jgi:hypothetical protein
MFVRFHSCVVRWVSPMGQTLEMANTDRVLPDRSDSE